MQPPALEMSGFRRSQRNCTDNHSNTLNREVVIIEGKAFEALMTDVVADGKVNRLCGR